MQQKNKRVEKSLWNNSSIQVFDHKSVFQQFEDTLKDQKEMPQVSAEGQTRLTLQLKNDNNRVMSLRE